MGEVNEPRFQSLAFSGTPWTRWASSLAINAGLVLAIVLIPVTVHQAIEPPPHVADLSLAVPVVSQPPKPVIRAIPPPPLPRPAPRVEFHAPPPKAPEAKAVVLPPPPVEVPKPIEGLKLEAPKIDLPAQTPVKQVVKLEVFPPTPPAPTAAQAPVKTVQTGGFGDSVGVSSATSAKRALTVGGFDSGGGVGAGPAKSKAVVSAGFGAYDAPAPGKQAARAMAPVETPVEITFKPKPLYTAEAREKKIEGEVTLEVLFASGGEIRVIRIIHGLGFGLDENARAAASQIRFHPGTRNGAPVDVTGVVHIMFELS